MSIFKEVCVNNLKEALQYSNKANRIELCSNLSEGGVTPSYGTLKACRAFIKIPVFVIVRPRGGDFIYSEEEKLTILEDTKIIEELGFEGLVFGAMNIEGQVDIDLCHKVRNIFTREMTFHMCFDFLKQDIVESLKIIDKIGFSRILTRGAETGSALLNYNKLILVHEEIQKHNLKLKLLPGGGLTNENIDEFTSKTNFIFKELHGSKIIN